MLRAVSQLTLSMNYTTLLAGVGAVARAGIWSAARAAAAV